MEFVTVQFCPCGHVYNMRKEEVIALGGGRQLDKIASGEKLDAVTLPSADCYDCQEEAERRDARLASLLSW